MAQTLWGERAKPRRRRRKRECAALPSKIPYSVTGGDDCAILGHTLNHFDLSGCTTCMACGARIFCPRCIPQHPADPEAAPELCPRHESEAKNDV